jgi:hypothetical protein
LDFGLGIQSKIQNGFCGSALNFPEFAAIDLRKLCIMSLQESWQQQQQHRQQASAHRRQAVSALLATARQERQDKSSQLRDELSLFHLSLVSRNFLRQAKFREFQRGLQQFCQDLREQTPVFLTEARDRRHCQAHQLAQELEAFVQVLQQQTTDLLTLTAAERTVRAAQISHDLQAFDRDLRTNVAALRTQFQANLAELRADTQEFLATAHHQRLVNHQQTVEWLASFMVDLRSQVQSYLVDLELARTQRSVANSPPPTAIPAAAVALPTVKTTPVVQSVKLPIVVMTPPTKVAASPIANHPIANNPAEECVYQYLVTRPGARLADIEMALNINRFQAVDALRSLIKKGIVTQRDRVYLPCEVLAPTRG